MPAVDTVVQCDVLPSFRVRQVEGMFDVPAEARAARRFVAQLPGDEEPWQIGAIVGPSGSGKTTVARTAFGPAVAERGRWPRARAVIDGFGERPIKTITSTLTAVGFSSPPAWLRPYHTLSNGEQFRCDLARALLRGEPLVVFDEFTSVVDRTVARIASAAVAKAVRAGRVSARQFVAVSCHYDILEWLCPDWVLDLATGELARGSLQRPLYERPPIELELFRCSRTAWRLFAPHHYLSGELHISSQCYLAAWQERPVAFVALLHAAGHRDWLRVSRLVTLPDYQGVGIGSAVLDAVCERAGLGHKRVTITTGHPAMIRRLAHSPLWRRRRIKRSGVGKNTHRAYAASQATARAVASFEYERNGTHPGTGMVHQDQEGPAAAEARGR